VVGSQWSVRARVLEIAHSGIQVLFGFGVSDFGILAHDGSVIRKRLLWVALIAAGCAIVFVVGALTTREREPEYGGKKLSEWAKIFSEAVESTGRLNEAQQAAEAIRAIGTNGVPHLVRWTVYRGPPLKRAYNDVREKLGIYWIPRFRDKNEDRPWHAICALMALDFQTIESGGGIDGWWKRLRHRMGTEELVLQLTNARLTPSTKMFGGFTLGCLGTNVPSAVPALEALYVDPNPHLRRVATNAVRRIRGGKL